MKIFVGLLVFFSIVFSAESRATGKWQPTLDNISFSLKSLINLFSNSIEEVKTALEEFMLEVGLEEWSESILQDPPGSSNVQYDAVVDELYSQQGFNITIPPAFKNLTYDCKICVATIYGLKFAVKKTNYTFVMDKMTNLCKSVLKPMGFRVDPLCEGTVELYGPHADKILNKNPIFLKSFCPYVNTCLPPRPKGLEVVENSNEINRLDPVERSLKDDDAIDDSDVITIAQLSDIHLEERYEDNTETDCGLVVCCIPKWGKGYSGHWGDYSCNIPPRTLESFVQKVKSLKPDLVLFTGDAAPHTFWEETFESQMQSTTATVQLLEKHLTKVLPVIGNHETYPTNLFSMAEVEESKDFIEHFITSWKNLSSLSPDNEKNLRRGGFYTQKITPTLRFITFNSAYMYTLNFYNVFNHKSLIGATEVRRTYNFIQDTLKQAAKDGEKVILAFHHPMGTSDFVASESTWLEKVLVDFKDTVVLVVNGHTHYNEFRVLYDKQKKPAVVTFAAPSVSSNNDRNPTMRLYRLRKKSFELIDYKQYYLDLSKLHDVKATNVVEHIRELYSAKAEYQLPDLSPQSWHSLINRMDGDEDLLYRHMTHFNSDAQEVGRITAEEKKEHICRLQNIHYDLYKECVNATVPSITLPPNFPTLKPQTAKPVGDF